MAHDYCVLVREMTIQGVSHWFLFTFFLVFLASKAAASKRIELADEAFERGGNVYIVVVIVMLFYPL